MSNLTGPPANNPAARLKAKAETIAVVVLTLALVLLYLAARDTGPFQAIEGQTLDWRFQLRGPQAVSPDIAIVAIDDRTLADLGRWPFSRAWLAAAVNATADDGAASIVFDLLLVGPEPGELPVAPPPSGMPERGGAPELIAQDADDALAAAMRRAGKVVVPFAFVYESERANATALPAAIERSAYSVVRSGAGGHSGEPDHPAGALVPLAAFLAAGNPAHTTVFVDAGGSLRFAHPAIRYGDSYYPSLPVEGVRQFLGVDRQDLVLDVGRGLDLAGRFFPTGPDLAMPINYAGPEGLFETWSFIDVAQGSFAPGSFRDRIVLIGFNVAGLGDRFGTPYSPALPGIEVYANIIDNFLGRGFLRRSPQTDWLDPLLIALGGLLALSLILLRRPARAILATAGLLAVWSAVAVHAFVAWQIWLNYVFPSLALLLGAAIVLAGLAVRETRRRTYAERRGATLSRYVSPLAMSDLRTGEGRGTEDRTQMAAVMFVDLVGFTHASERMTPAATAQLLRRFHACVEDIARDHGGTIDKFIGDAALVVFGMSQASFSDAAAAIACARRIVGALEDWSGETADADEPRLKCGIGIDFGAVTIAEVGGRSHAQITVTGDTVNVASRLEALTRDWATNVIISDTVFDAVLAAGTVEMLEGFQELPVERVRGRDQSIRLWAWPAPPQSGSLS